MVETGGWSRQVVEAEPDADWMYPVGGADRPQDRVTTLIEAKTTMSFCEHCEGQRFDRAQVLRALRAARKSIREQGSRCRADSALAMAIKAVRGLEIPHLERPDDLFDGEVVH